MERVASILLQEFSKRLDVELHLVVYGIDRHIAYDVPPCVTIHVPPFDFRSQHRIVSAIRTLGFLRRSVRRINPDAVLSFGERWNSFVLISQLGCRNRVFVADRSNPKKSLGRVHDLLRNVLYPRSSGLIVQTRKAWEIAQRNRRNRNIEIIGNPIREIGHSDGPRKNVVLTIGRLIKTKNLDRLIRNFAEIGRSDWKLVIVGGDAQKQQHECNLKALAQELGAESYIRFEGFQSDVEAYYRESKIFAFTSSSEGFPNVIGEALAFGLPTVSYDCTAGPSEMITDGENGYLVPTFDDDAFRQKLALLMDNEDLRAEMSEDAARSIQKFHSGVIADQFYSFIAGEAEPAANSL